MLVIPVTTLCRPLVFVPPMPDARTRGQALATGSSALRSLFLFPATVALGLAPGGVAATLYTPDKELHLSIAQVGAGLSLYLWISYYLCFFLPYRVLHDDYQSYRRRAAQVGIALKDGVRFVSVSFASDFRFPPTPVISRGSTSLCWETRLVNDLRLIKEKKLERRRTCVPPHRTTLSSASRNG